MEKKDKMKYVFGFIMVVLLFIIPVSRGEEKSAPVPCGMAKNQVSEWHRVYQAHKPVWHKDPAMYALFRKNVKRGTI